MNQTTIKVKASHVIEACTQKIQHVRIRRDEMRENIAQNFVGMNVGSFLKPVILKDIEEARLFVSKCERKDLIEIPLYVLYREELIKLSRLIDDYITLKNMARVSADGLINLSKEDFQFIGASSIMRASHKEEEKWKLNMKKEERTHVDTDSYFSSVGATECL